MPKKSRVRAIRCPPGTVQDPLVKGQCIQKGVSRSVEFRDTSSRHEEFNVVHIVENIEKDIGKDGIIATYYSGDDYWNEFVPWKDLEKTSPVLVTVQSIHRKPLLELAGNKIVGS